MSSRVDRDIFLSIVIPAYNEAGVIERTVNSVREYCAYTQFTWEIIAVDDGSDDDTAERAQHALRGVENARVIRNAHNHGKGWAVKEGMLSAKGKYRLFMDADNSTPIEHWEKAWPLFEMGADVVIGSRAIKGAVLVESQPWYRRTLGVLGNAYAQLVLLNGITDSQCGFKCFSAQAAESIFTRVTTRRWAFDIEVLALARAMKYEIDEFPVRWTRGKRSSVKFGDYLGAFFDTLRIVSHIRKEFPYYKNIKNI